MIMKSYFILYVEDQNASMEFYSKILDMEPTLNIPGMTEFYLTKNSTLGLMPQIGIENLLDNKISAVPNNVENVKAELYLIVDCIKPYLNRAKLLSAPILSEAEIRGWGDNAAYFLDPDQHVIAIAEKNKSE